MRVRTPAAVTAAAGVAVVLLAVPLVGIGARTPWSSLWSIVSRPAVVDALLLSLIVTLGATVLATLLGVPLAVVVARAPGALRPVLRAVALVPLVLPPVVGGVALLVALGRRGFVGQWLDRWFGLTLPFTTPGAVVAATFVALPFVVLTVEGGLRRDDGRIEEAAAALGARPWTVFRRVTLPLLRPHIAAGAALASARALGEFGATITFAGNLRGATQTLPLAVFFELERDPGAAVALSLVLVGLSLVVLLAMRDRWLVPTR